MEAVYIGSVIWVILEVQVGLQIAQSRSYQYTLGPKVGILHIYIYVYIYIYYLEPQGLVAAPIRHHDAFANPRARDEILEGSKFQDGTNKDTSLSIYHSL